MKKLLPLIILLSCASLRGYAEVPVAEIKIRDLDLVGLLVKDDDMSLTVTFDVKQERELGELIFDFYLLLIPKDKNTEPQFFHARTVHRYLDEKTGQRSGVLLNTAVLKTLEPRGSKYAVVISRGDKEIAAENSEKDRWWEDPELGAPVEHLLRRSEGLPIIRTWESAGGK